MNVIILAMRIRKHEITDQEINLIANISDAFAHPARIKIFRFIMTKNKERIPVFNKTVVDNFGYAQATISQHLSKLKIAKLLKVEDENGRLSYYANIGILSKYLKAVKNFDIK